MGLGMNKHAYLIIAHNEPEILSIVLSLLDDDKNHFYIHIDKKSKCFNEIQDNVLKLHASQVYFPVRMNVTWGGDSLIECMLSLLEQAVNSGENYSFYHFLSGADMPIKPKDYIYNFFQERKNCIFLDFDSKTMDEKYRERIKYYYFFQNRVGKEDNIFSKIQNKTVDFQKMLNMDRCREQLYQKGSNWCSLNSVSAEYILKNKKKLLKEFKHTLIGDESFIHTAIFNSEHINNVYKYEEENGNAARFIDWDRGNPYTFREEDFNDLMNSDAMFARKFSWEKDKNIIMKIYKSLMEKESGE